MKLFAKLMVKLLPKAKEVPDLTKRPDENQYDYQVRVPLIKQPTLESPKLNYRGKPMR